SWVNRKVVFEKLPAGFYLVEASQGRNIAWSPLLVSDIGLLTKTGRSSRLIYGFDIKENTPLADAELFTFSHGESGYELLEQQKLKDGVVFDKKVSFDDGNQQVFLLKKGDHYALSDFGYRQRGGRPHNVAIFTDRPVYRLGHEIFF